MRELLHQKFEGGAMEVIMVGVLFAVIAFSGGAVMFADSARPGDRLYMLDRAVESIQKTFTFDSEKKANLAIELMEERQEELYSLIESNADRGALHEARYEFEKSVKVAFQNTDGEEANKKLQAVMARLEDNSLKQQEKIEEAIDKIPDEAMEALKEAQEVSSEGLQQAQEAISKSTQGNNTDAQKNQESTSSQQKPSKPAVQSILQPLSTKK